MNLFSKVKSKLTAGKKKVIASVAIVGAAMMAMAGSAFATTTSNAVDFSSTGGLGIDVADVVSTGFSFAKLFNSYTTLIVAIIMAPVLIGFIVWLFKKMPKMGR